MRLDARNAVAQATRSKFPSAVGRVDEAAEAVLVAVALDPRSVGYLGQASRSLALAGRCPEAIRFANRAWEIDSTLSSTGQMETVLWERGQVAEARQRADVLLRLSSYPGSINRALYVIAKTGDPGRAATLLSQQRAHVLVAATVVPAATFSLGGQGVLVDGSPFLFDENQQARSYDVAPGDQRFVFMRKVLPTGPTAAAPHNLVQVTSWAAEVQAKITGKPLKY